jgi:hypothetical protein
VPKFEIDFTITKMADGKTTIIADDEETAEEMIESLTLEELNSLCNEETVWYDVDINAIVEIT